MRSQSSGPRGRLGVEQERIAVIVSNGFLQRVAKPSKNVDIGGIQKWQSCWGCTNIDTDDRDMLLDIIYIYIYY